MATVNLQGQDVYLDDFIIEKLDNIKKILKRNFDCMFIVDGEERSGKSTFALTMATYLFPDMCANNMAIDAEDAIKKLSTMPKGSPIIIDEGSLMFGSKDTMTREQKHIIKILNVIGQKNLIFMICLPSFFSLNDYVAADRSRFLVHVYTDNNLNRGQYCYWGKGKLKKLYREGKKQHGKYRVVRPDFYGKFTDFRPSWYDEYLKIKEKSLLSAIEGKKPSDRESARGARWKMQLNTIIREVIYKDYLSYEELAALIELDVNSLYEIAPARARIKNLMKNENLKIPISAMAR